jgi:hypothetical protein
MQEGLRQEAEQVREKAQGEKAGEGEEVKMFKRTTLLLLALTFVGVIAIGSSSALATGDPAWSITGGTSPTYLPPNSTNDAWGSRSSNTVELTARNLGDVAIDGSSSPIVLSLDLREGGVTPSRIGAVISETSEEGRPILEEGFKEQFNCVQPAGPCTYEGTIPAGSVVNVIAKVATGAPGTVTSTATISGGTDEAGDPVAAASVAQQLTVSSESAPFGIQPSSLLAEFSDAGGSPETQAGAHPYQFNLSLLFNDNINSEGKYNPVEDVKDLVLQLPPGVAGNELALSQCASLAAGCSGASLLGTVHFGISGGVSGVPISQLYNLKPDNGHTNELGFSANTGEIHVHLLSSVRTESDYGLDSTTSNIPGELGSLTGITTDVWGVPADPSHGSGSPLPPAAFFTMPSQCGRPLVFRVIVDSYLHPGRLTASGAPDLSDPNWKAYSVTGPAMTGCELLPAFTPSLSVAPDTTYSDTPAGTTVEVSVPQGEGLTSPTALATSTLQNTNVTLPQGVVVSPGQANGLGACQPSEDGVGTGGPPSCPADSRVGSDLIETPLLPDKLEGSVYVLQSNPPNLEILVAASADDVNLKLVGDVHLNEQTGQLTTTFTETPALPFTHFRLTFSGGAQAALTTPAGCGTYASTADFTPWASPGTPDFLSSDAFGIDSGPGGSACQSPLPFAPSLVAGATTDQAGGYTDFSLLLSRGDGQQRIAALQFKTPAGLLGMLSKVPLCGEPQAAAGTCSAQSQIGHTVVGAGAGPDPLYVPEAGQAPAPIYLTGPYKGAPFGLSIVVPVIAGPFNLGTVVVRAAISVDPKTAQLTISTDPLPQILHGVPTDLRQIDAVIDRAGFMFNPTSCAPGEFSGVAQSAQGADAAISSHFQVGSCQSLQFKPDFKVSTSGRTSRSGGASLDAKVIYPAVALTGNQASSQANIASVKVDLPKQLPSRLSTLQKACTAAQFEANPAGCPTASRIGVVKALTPVLPVTLTGPVYFVSHGNEAFPSLVAVLQGDGVRVDLTAATFISKAGITSSTFKQIPDVPISSFELYLPEGHYSALASNLPEKDHGNLCGQKLAMPTAFTAQNGAVIHQSTPIAVTGCAKTTTKKKAKAKTKQKAKPKAKKTQNSKRPTGSDRGSS